MGRQYVIKINAGEPFELPGQSINDVVSKMIRNREVHPVPLGAVVSITRKGERKSRYFVTSEDSLHQLIFTVTVNEFQIARAQAPAIPDETCGLIDIIGSLIGSDGLQSDGERQMAQAYLERLRASNDALRRSSKYWYDFAKAQTKCRPAKQPDSA